MPTVVVFLGCLPLYPALALLAARAAFALAEGGIPRFHKWDSRLALGVFAVIGFAIGDDFKLASYDQSIAYFRALDEASDRVVDPGDEPDILLRRLDELGTEPSAIVNTHGHLDHIGAVPELRRHFDIPFAIHPKDRMFLDNVNEHARMFGLDKKGVIEPGAYADLLIVEGNPLDDIKVMMDPENNLKLIIKDGKIYKNTVSEKQR